MQNSHSFKSYVLDSSEVAGFKANLQNLEFEAGTSTTGIASNTYSAWAVSNRLSSSDNIKVLETKI